MMVLHAGVALTVSSTQREARSLCDGVSTVFAVPFQYIAPGDLKVVLVDSATGVSTELAEGVDYHVRGDGRNGLAQVVTAVAYPAGRRIVRRRDTASLQLAAYVANDGFPAATHEAQLDRLTMVDQEQASDLDDVETRALTVPDGETAGMLPPAAARADTLLGFGPAGEPRAVSRSDIDGRSAYQLWLGMGNVGTLQDFFDAIGNVEGVTLGQFRGVIDTALDDKADRLPVNAASPVIAGASRAMIAVARTLYDPNTTENVDRMPRIRPSIPSGTQFGVVNNSLGAGLHGTTRMMGAFWMMANIHNVFYEQWLSSGRTDVVAARMIAEQWENMRVAYTFDELASDGSRDGTINVSDDAAWKAMYLRQVHEATGALDALETLRRMIPRVLWYYRDPQPGTQVVVGDASDGPGRFAYSRYGILYAVPGQDPNGQGRSTFYELGIVLSSLYVHQVTGDESYLLYATGAWQLFFTYFRDPRGIYWADLQIDPTRQYDGTPYLKPLHTERTNPKRRYTGHALAGCFLMAILSARLYRLTNDVKYWAEALSIVRGLADVYIVPDGSLLNDKDAWTQGFSACSFVREVFTLPGVDPDRRLMRAFVKTASNILDGRVGDTYTPDWNPNLPASLNGFAETGYATWLENGAARPGDQATLAQTMTTATSVVMAMAGAIVARFGLDLDTPTGMSLGTQLATNTGAAQIGTAQGSTVQKTIDGLGLTTASFGGSFTQALQAARLALPAGGGAITIPAGDYTLTAQPFQGPPIVWRAEGVTINGGVPVLPGIVDTMLGGGRFLRQSYTTADGAPTFRVQREATHAGGTSGSTGQAILATTVAGKDNANWEWAVLGQVLSYTTGAQQNVGTYGQAINHADGTSWGMCSENRDAVPLPNPTRGKVGLESGMSMSGPDDHGNRVGVDVALHGTLTNGAQTVFGWGVRVNGTAINGVSPSLVRYAMAVTNIDFRYGLSTRLARQAPGGAAVDMADGQDISLSSSTTRRMRYDPTGDAVVIENGDVTLLKIVGNGAVDASQAFTIDNLQVVGRRRGAIADATSDTVVATINAVLMALRGHGLIGS